MYNYLYNVVVIYTDHNNNAGINVKTEGGGGGMGKGAAFEFFGIFWVKFPTLGTGK